MKKLLLAMVFMVGCTSPQCWCDRAMPNWYLGDNASIKIENIVPATQACNDFCSNFERP